MEHFDRRGPTHRVLTGLLVVTLALVAGACGDDDADSASGPEPTPITADEFLERANDICADAEADLEDLQEPETIEQAASIVRDRLIPSIRRQIADIRELGFPEEDREQLDAVFARAEETLDDVEEDVEGALVTEEDPFAQVNEELSDYGLDRCAG